MSSTLLHVLLFLWQWVLPETTQADGPQCLVSTLIGQPINCETINALFSGINLLPTIASRCCCLIPLKC